MTIMEMRQKRAKLINDCRDAFNDAGKNESEQLETSLRYDAEIETIEKLIDVAEKNEAREAKLDELVSKPISQNNRQILFNNDVRSTPEYKENFFRAALGLDFDKRTMVSTSGAAGGNLLPTYLADNIVELALQQSTLRLNSGVNVQTCEGDIDVPYISGAITGYIPGSETAALTAGDPTIGKTSFKPFPFTAYVPMSIKIMRDGKGLESFIRTNMTQTVINLSEDKAFNGTGGGVEPVGVLTTATAHTSTLTNTTYPTIDELIDMEAGLLSNYLVDAEFWMSAATFANIRKIKELTTGGNKNVLSVDGKIDYLLGYKVNKTSYMPSGTGNKIVLFGSKRFVTFMDRTNPELKVYDQMMNSSQLPTLTVGFATIFYSDSALIQPKAMVVATSA